MIEGSFTATDLQDGFESGAVMMDGEIEGCTLSTVQSYRERAMGLQDGRRLFVDDTPAIKNPRKG